MAYNKVGWKDYPSTDTPINAANLDHMDAGILENAQTIGDKTKISGIGDGTVAGAIAANNLSLNNCLKSVSDGKKLVADAITAYGYQTATDASFETIAESAKHMGNVRYNNGYSVGYNAGTSAGNYVQRSANVTYTLNPNGNNKYGSEQVSFVFPSKVLGVANFTQTAAICYCYITNISISNNVVTLTLEHAHGVNSSTNTVTLYCNCAS